MLRGLTGATRPGVVCDNNGTRRRIKLHNTGATARVVHPSVTFTLSAKATKSAPKVAPRRTSSRLNGKPRLLVCSTSVVPRHNLHSFVINITRRYRVPFRCAIVANNKASTNTRRRDLSNVPSFTVAIPMQCLRSRASVVRRSSCLGTIGLIARVIGHLSTRAIERVHRGI